MRRVIQQRNDLSDDDGAQIERVLRDYSEARLDDRETAHQLRGYVPNSEGLGMDDLLPLVTMLLQGRGGSGDIGDLIGGLLGGRPANAGYPTHQGRDLGIAVQAEMIAPYLELREDLQRGAYASYTAELLDRFTNEGEDDYHTLFQLFDETLHRLCTDDDPRLATRYYEVRLLEQVGFRPELNECVVSREAIQAEDQYFSYAGGGVVRPEYATRAGAITPIPMVTLKLLRHMQRSAYSHVKTLKISVALHDDVERVVLGYLTYLLERKLQSVDFIRRIRARS
ncbi:MAG: DNA repair protein RecO [Anaerolineae bacterium]|nr:DNA repair protein RecO [Anaerolineae bacterium]